MSVSDNFRDFVIEQLAPLGPVKIRRMFGGGGVMVDGVMFGLIYDDVLFLKADDGNRPMFEIEGMGPFVYVAKGKTQTMSYWQTPERLYDEPDELLVFARAAVAAAHRGVMGKKKSGQRVPQGKRAGSRNTRKSAR
jgi:DNA transformation protein and related proteins